MGGERRETAERGRLRSGPHTSAMGGTCDIGMASRDLKDEEKSALKVETIAKDGIAVIVNNANTCDDLTLDQVKSIYTGETTVWSDIIK